MAIGRNWRLAIMKQVSASKKISAFHNMLLANIVFLAAKTSSRLSVVLWFFRFFPDVWYATIAQQPSQFGDHWASSSGVCCYGISGCEPPRQGEEKTSAIQKKLEI